MKNLKCRLMCVLFVVLAALFSVALAEDNSEAFLKKAALLRFLRL